MKRVLNLYAGIGGNRKLWEGVKVTAIEINPKIAKIYQDFFPDDEIIITDAHQYLLDHYNDSWEFIWSSPPCQTHTLLNCCNESQGYKVSYPDMSIYQEIIWLKHFFKKQWAVENVRSYYEPLIKPKPCSNHYFWSNFDITDINFGDTGIPKRGGIDYEKMILKKGFDIMNYTGVDKRALLRNCIIPELGKHIFDCAFKFKQIKLPGGPQ